MDYQKTGQVIALRRQKLALTQKALAQRLNISDRTVSRWERGVGFPDISLLEPLADELGLSVLELIHGQRLPQPPEPGAEQDLRTASRDLGGYFRRALRRFQRLLLALAAALVLLAGGFLWLWFHPYQRTVIELHSVTAAQAAGEVPFCVITRREFELAARLLEREEITARFSDRTSAVSLPLSLLEGEELEIDGQPARASELTVIGYNIFVDYAVSQSESASGCARRCILEITPEGQIHKSAAEYGGSGPKVAESLDNEQFTLLEGHRDLMAPLSGEK